MSFSLRKNIDDSSRRTVLFGNCSELQSWKLSNGRSVSDSFPMVFLFLRQTLAENLELNLRSESVLRCDVGGYFYTV